MQDSSTGELKFWGNCTDDVKISLMQSAKALIYPLALLEIHSHKSVEAMMCGCSVITYNLGAMKEVMGDYGCVVDTEEQFLAAMGAVPPTPEIVRNYALSRWATSKVVADCLKLLEEVAGGRRW